MSGDRPSDLSIAHLGDAGEMKNIVECFVSAAKLTCMVEGKAAAIGGQETFARGAVIIALLVATNEELVQDLKTMSRSDGARAIYEACNWESLDEDT